MELDLAARNSDGHAALLPKAAGARLIEACDDLDSVCETFTKAIAAAFDALRAAMVERDISKLRLNGTVSYLNDDAVCGRFVAVALCPDGQVVVVNSAGEHVSWKDLDNGAAHSVICLLTEREELQSAR